MTETMTKITNLIDPEVMADMLDTKLTDAIKFSPLAEVDYTLVGTPGDTVTLPKYAYIGDAADVTEGAAIPMKTLTATSAKVKVKKAGNGIELTDEALLSGYGDPAGEASKQLVLSIASKIDADIVTTLAGIVSGKTVDVHATSALNADAIADALVKFGEDETGEKVLFVAPEQLAQLRKSEDWIKATDMGVEILMSGVMGMIHGCQVVVSNRIKASASKFTNFIVKPGALAIYLKRDTLVETDRDIIHKSTAITADKHYAVYLKDDSKAVKLIVAENQPTVPGV